MPDVEAYLELDLDDPRAWESPQARNLHWPCLTIRLIAEAYGITKTSGGGPRPSGRGGIRTDKV